MTVLVGGITLQSGHHVTLTVATLQFPSDARLLVSQAATVDPIALLTEIHNYKYIIPN